MEPSGGCGEGSSHKNVGLWQRCQVDKVSSHLSACDPGHWDECIRCVFTQVPPDNYHWGLLGRWRLQVVCTDELEHRACDKLNCYGTCFKRQPQSRNVNILVSSLDIPIRLVSRSLMLTRQRIMYLKRWIKTKGIGNCVKKNDYLPNARLFI